MPALLSSSLFAAPVGNDFYAGATVLDLTQAWGNKLSGESNVGYTLEAGEQTTAFGFGCKSSAWYKFVAPFTGSFVWAIRDPTFDCLTDAGQGGSASAYTPTVSYEANGVSNGKTIAVTSGQTYYIRVTSYTGSTTGTYDFEWTLNDDLANAATIHTTTGSVTAGAWGTTLQASEGGYAGGSIWFRFKTGGTGGACQIDTVGTQALTGGGDSVMQLYTSSTPTTPTIASLTQVATDDGSGGNNDAKLTNSLSTNTDYFVQIQPRYNANPGNSPYKFNWSIPSVV